METLLEEELAKEMEKVVLLVETVLVLVVPMVALVVVLQVVVVPLVVVLVAPKEGQPAGQREVLQEGPRALKEEKVASLAMTTWLEEMGVT